MRSSFEFYEFLRGSEHDNRNVVVVALGDFVSQTKTIFIFRMRRIIEFGSLFPEIIHITITITLLSETNGLVPSEQQ
jgi:hypothetical protein